MSKLFALIAVLVLLGCSKKKEDNPDDIKTYVVIRNSVSYTLEKVLVGYFDNNVGKTILIKDVGNILSNTSSPQIEISNDKVLPELYVYFHEGSNAKIVVPAFKLFRHIENVFELDADNVGTAYDVEMDGPHYPGGR